MNSMELLGIPEAKLLIISIIAALCLSPFLRGLDFGVLKFPDFPKDRTSRLTWLFAMVLLGLLLLPMFPKPSANMDQLLIHRSPSSAVESLQEITNQYTSDLTDAEKLVSEYRNRVNTLRGEYESCRKHPVSCQNVIKTGPQYAASLLLISNDDLDPGHVLMKYQCAVIALVFSADLEPRRGIKTSYASEGIRAASDFFVKAEETEKRFNESDFYSYAVRRVLQEDRGADRVRYYLAMAYSIRARSTASSDDLEAAIAEIARISSGYITDYPPEEEPALKWALVQSTRGELG